MKDLAAEQREMRERMNQQTANMKSKTKPKSAVTAARIQDNPSSAPADDIKALQKQIRALETENRALRAGIETLRRQKTVFVERETSAEDERRENAHNYFKYGGGRRW